MASRDSTRKKKILYLMHVDWRWIKQRPQFLAEGLGEKADVFVLYRIGFAPSQKIPNRSSVRKFPLLPIPRRLGAIFRTVDTMFQRALVAIISIFFRPNYVWVTHPSLFSYIPEFVLENGSKLIYDCMDDVLGFGASSDNLAYLTYMERKTICVSTIVLCSSLNLQKVLSTRHGYKEKYRLLRNGLSEEFVNAVKTVSSTVDNCKIRVGYIGTIAEWMDYRTLQFCLDKIPELTFELIGPKPLSIVKHPNLIYHGPVAHEDLRDSIAEMDALIMPFVVTELIESVDPVKLYEYVSFGKPVISVYYPEISRFTEYVHFYSSEYELHDLLVQLKDDRLPGKATVIGVKRFLSENTWECRVHELEPLLFL